MAVQLVPSFVERKCRRHQFQHEFAPYAARDFTEVLVKPELTGTQLMPLFEERKTPPYSPGEEVGPETASVRFLCPSNLY